MKTIYKYFFTLTLFFAWPSLGMDEKEYWLFIGNSDSTRVLIENIMEKTVEKVYPNCFFAVPYSRTYSSFRFYTFFNSYKDLQNNRIYLNTPDLRCTEVKEAAKQINLLLKQNGKYKIFFVLDEDDEDFDNNNNNNDAVIINTIMNAINLPYKPFNIIVHGKEFTEGVINELNKGANKAQSIYYSKIMYYKKASHNMYKNGIERLPYEKDFNEFINTRESIEVNNINSHIEYALFIGKTKRIDVIEILKKMDSPVLKERFAMRSIYDTRFYGLTKHFSVYEDKIYLDTPRLSELDTNSLLEKPELIQIQAALREQAAKQIEEGLKQNGNYKIFFTVYLNNGSVKTDDLITINSVMNAINLSHKPFNIIIVVDEAMLPINRAQIIDQLNSGSNKTKSIYFMFPYTVNHKDFYSFFNTREAVKIYQQDIGKINPWIDSLKECLLFIGPTGTHKSAIINGLKNRFGSDERMPLINNYIIKDTFRKLLSSSLYEADGQTHIIDTALLEQAERTNTNFKWKDIYEDLQNNKVYIDTPGLANSKINEEAFKRHGKYKIFFVILLNEDRVRPEDLTTINTVMNSINLRYKPFNIIVIENKKMPPNKQSQIIDQLNSISNKTENIYFMSSYNISHNIYKDFFSFFDTSKTVEIHPKNIREAKSSKEYWVFIGNPGVGKSTIINALVGKTVAKVGLSAGHGLTDDFIIYEDCENNRVYCDTPGLADLKRKEDTAKQIEEGLKQDGKYKIFFVIQLNEARVREEDVTTINTVMNAINLPYKPFNIIINKIEGDEKEFLDSDELNKEKVLDALNREKNKTQSVFYIDRSNKLKKRKIEFLELSDELYNFFNTSETIQLNKEKVGPIKEVKELEVIKTFEQQLDLIRIEIATNNNETSKRSKTLMREIAILIKSAYGTTRLSKLPKEVAKIYLRAESISRYAVLHDFAWLKLIDKKI